MNAIDTNIVVRYLVRDDVAQAAAAEHIMQEQCYVSLTVLLETVWLLSSRYGLSRTTIARALMEFISIPTLTTIDDNMVRWAVERFQSGADFADMAHVLNGRLADQFATFDCGLAKAAGKRSPVPILTVKA